MGWASSAMLERETGFEPATPSLEGWCSSQLSYSRKTLNPIPFRDLDTRYADSIRIWIDPRFRISRVGGERRIRTSVGQRPADLQSAPFNRFGISPRNSPNLLVPRANPLRRTCSDTIRIMLRVAGV
jgi:hypothetical protein